MVQTHRGDSSLVEPLPSVNQETQTLNDDSAAYHLVRLAVESMQAEEHQ